MATFGSPAKSYVDFRNINLKGGSLGTGLIRWAPAVSGSTTLWSVNPFSSTDYGLFLDASGNLNFSSLGVTTILGAAGGGSGSSTFNGVYANSQTLTVSAATFTIDGTHASNNVLTVSDSAAGSGHLIQITNTGTGSDINGTSGTWGFSKAGAGTALTLALAGTAGSTSLSLTLGNIVTSAGGLSLTKAADNATLSVTNNSVATAVASTFTLNGLTTGGGLLITSSGTIATTGYLLTLTGNSATTGAGLFRLNANGLTSGIAAVITSSATAITGAGRLLRVDHTGTTSSSGILSEFASAAADGTVIVKITASGILTGTALAISAALATSGNGLTIANLDALTTGLGVQIASAATAITGAGRLLFINHTGATSSTGTLVEFKTAATDAVNATTLLKLTSAASIVGINLSIVGTTGMTTGSLIRATSSTAAAVATNGIYSFLLTGAFTSTASTLGAFHVAGASTVSGTIMSILGGSQTTGIALNVTDPGTGMTSGSLIRAITATTGAIATNGVVSFQASGDHTSTSNQGFVGIIDATTAGTAMSIATASLTTGVALFVSNTTSGVTSGSLVRVAASGTGTIATNGIVSIRHAGIFVSTANAGVLDVQASALVGAGTLVNLQSTAASQTAAQILNIVQSGATLTGYTSSIVSATAGFSGAGSTGNLMLLTSVHDVAGNALKIVANSLTLGTGTGMLISHTTSVLGAGTSLLRLSSTSVDTGTTTGTLLDLASTATSGHVALITASAGTSGSALVINVSGGSQTTASAILVTQTTTATGYTGSLVSITGSSTTGSGNALGVTGVNTTAGDTVKFTNNALVAGTSTILNLSHGTSVLGAGNSMLRITSSTVDLGTTTGTLLDLAANSATSAILSQISATGLTTGTAFKIIATSATLTTGFYFAANDSTGNVFTIGSNGHLTANLGGATAPVMSTNSTGISATAIVAGSTDVCGSFTTTGTPASGTVLTLTFHKTYTVAPKFAVVSPINAAAANPNTLPTIATTATTITFTWPAGGTYAATPSYSYFVCA